jgi:hypothetical protein
MPRTAGHAAYGGKGNDKKVYERLRSNQKKNVDNAHTSYFLGGTVKEMMWAHGSEMHAFVETPS